MQKLVVSNVYPFNPITKKILKIVMLVHIFSVILFSTLFFSVIHFILNCFDVSFLGSCLSNVYLYRCLISILISLVVAAWGLKRKSIDWSGAISGFFVGLILSFSSYCFLACLLTFFYTSSKATHLCSAKKKKIEVNFKEGGQRNWIQVICNGGTAVEVAIFYALQGGIGESSIDFSMNPVRSWLAAAVLSSLAGVTGDTWASELGTVLSKTEPRLITSLKKVPIGTNGGCTLCGLLYSALGGLIIGFAYFIALLFTDVQAATTQQAVFLAFIGFFAGAFGSVFDSILGATLQYSGLDIRSGKIVEQPNSGVQHISGRPLLSNHSVNLIMSIVNSLVVPTISLRLYPLFR